MCNKFYGFPSKKKKKKKKKTTIFYSVRTPLKEMSRHRTHTYSHYDIAYGITLLYRL